MGITFLGIIAGTLTTLAFLPQFMKTWKTQSARDFSWGMLSTFCVGIFLWFVYGILRSDQVIIIANLITLILNLGIVTIKFKAEKPRRWR